MRKFLGVLCIIAGALLGFVPLVPGIVLVLLGLELLGIPVIPWKRMVEVWRARKEKRKESKDEVY